MIQEDNARIEYIANGGTVFFDFPYVLTDTSNVNVYLKTNGETTEILPATESSEGIRYTLTAIDGDYRNGATVRFVSGLGHPYLPPVDTKVVITRTLSITQMLDLKDTAVVPNEEIEAALDKLTMLISQITALVGRSISTPLADSDDVSLELPAAGERANRYAAFDALGNIIATQGPAGDSDVPVSEYAEGLLSSATAAAARSLLGITRELINSLLGAEFQAEVASGLYRYGLFPNNDLYFKKSTTGGDVHIRLTKDGKINVDAVELTGAQTIAGVKTFSDNAVFGGDITVAGNINGLKIPVLSADPAEPEIGQIWLRE